MCSADLFLGILAILFPPLPVWVKRGICSADSIINILLCVLGYLPGLLHSWYIIAKFPEDTFEYQQVPRDSEGGRVTYVIVQEDSPRRQQGRQAQPKAQHQGGMNYGTASNATQAGSSSSTAAQAGSSNGNSDHQPAPPTYAEAVKGDNKVQTHD